jgi:hypothetical protein
MQTFCISCVGTTRDIASIQWWFLSRYFSGARPHTRGAFKFKIFLSLVDDLCCVCSCTPSRKWHRCPEIGTSSAVSTGPNWGLTWRWRQNPVSETLRFEK